MSDRRTIESTYPAASAAAITPNDDADLPTITRGLYVGTGGDLTVILADDDAAVTFGNLSAGIVYPLRIKRVLSTGTTASGLIGLA